MDAVAARLGLDTVEVRQRNLINKSEFPYPLPFATLGIDVVLNSGDYAGLLDSLHREWNGNAMKNRVAHSAACLTSASGSDGLGPRSARVDRDSLSKNAYRAGRTNSVSKVELISPPMTTVASGF
jgi:Molybdopterin-binding domain of aldehyde dehydrogenase